MSKPINVTHTDIESFAAAEPMDSHPQDVCLLTTVGGIEVSAMPRSDCRGLMVALEVELAEFIELAFDRPVAIRNAVYAIIGAMGEPLRLTGVGGVEPYDPESPPWHEFAAEQQWDDE